MRIGCLQFAPQVGDVNNNLNRADAVLSKADPDGLDLLVLPELAFSGYNFKSLQHIAPYLEHSGSGITSLWARTTALKYNCNLVVGYPEKVDVTDDWPANPEYYNAALVVNEDGETIANYRKSFLYYTDETWALEGDEGFYRGRIPGLGRTSIGICMDINPYKFEAPWHAYEFAFHVLESYSNLVIVSMAWLTRENAQVFTSTPHEPDMDTLTYWVARLEPLIRNNNDDEIIVVLCNRAGIEDDAVYAGTSAVLGVQNGEVRIYGILGRGEKKLLVVDTNEAPYARLVYRPESENKVATQDDIPGAAEPQASPSTNTSNAAAFSNNQAGSTSPAPPSEPSADSKTVSVRSHSSKESTEHTPVAKRTKPPKILTGQDMPNSPLRSPGNQSLNLPTPSAPSPTPFSTRPKLTIPVQSPKAREPLSPEPKSSLSIWSSRSLLSDDSATSYEWISQGSQYVEGNEVLNRYLATPPSGPIVDGQVSNAEACFSPITPFDEMVPSLFRSSRHSRDNSARRLPVDKKTVGLDSPTEPKASEPDEQMSLFSRREEKPIKHRHNSFNLRTSIPKKGDAIYPLRATPGQQSTASEPRESSRSKTRDSSRTKAEQKFNPEVKRKTSSVASKSRADIQSRAYDRLDTSSPQSGKSHSSVQHLDFTPRQDHTSHRRRSRSDARSPNKVGSSRVDHETEALGSFHSAEDVVGRPASASHTNQWQRQQQRATASQSSHRRTRSSSDRNLGDVGVRKKTTSTTLGNTKTTGYRALRNQHSDLCLSHRTLALREHQPRLSTETGQIQRAEALNGSTYFDIGSSSFGDGKPEQRGGSNPRTGAWSLFEPRTPTAMLGLRDEETIVG